MNQERRKIWRLIFYAECLGLVVIPFGALSRILSGRSWDDLAWASILQLAAMSAFAMIFSAAWLFVQPSQLFLRLLRNFLLMSGELLALFLATRLFRVIAGLGQQDIDWRLIAIFVLGGGFLSAVALTLIEGRKPG